MKNRRAKVRAWNRGKRHASVVEAIIGLIILLVAVIGMNGPGLLLWAVPGALIFFWSGKEVIFGMPRPWIRRLGPAWTRERHIKDCPHCTRGGVPKPLLASFLAHGRDIQCPHCYGAGKVRHPDNEWYYERHESKRTAAAAVGR